MVINTLFSHGDEVFTLSRDRISQGTISSIRAEVDSHGKTIINYMVRYGECNYDFVSEERVAFTKADLITKL